MPSDRFWNYKIWRVGLQWYVVAILLIPAIQIASLLAVGVLSEGPAVDPASPLGETVAQMGVVGALAFFPVTVLAQMFSSPLLEEFGWRGPALPRLQDRSSALTSSVILGLIVGIWHLPLTLAYGDPVAPYLLRIVAITILVTWVFNNTRGSVLLAMVFHASANASLVPLSGGSGPWPSVLLTLAVACAVVTFNGPSLASGPSVTWSRVTSTYGSRPGSSSSP